jgi:Domain of unknown function (DUF4384)
MMNQAIWKAILMTAFAIPAFAQTEAKGIYVEGSRPAMKFNVLLDRDKEMHVVPAGYAFQSGDRMKFQFDLNKDLYVYVLHRTVTGDERTVDRYAGTKGIEVIYDDDRKNKRRDSYDLLFPSKASGGNNLIRAHEIASIPRGDQSFFRMDNKPGMEKLIVVASTTRIRIEDFFDVDTGRMRAEDGNRKPNNDRDDDVLGQLNRSLHDLSGNSLVDGSSSKGITVENPDGYAAARESGKAIIVTVDLRHLARR